MRWIVCDYETASGCDLKVAGADAYASNPTTEILCLSWEDQDGRRELWAPDMGSAIPASMRAAIEDPDTIFVAHNCRFERAIWRELQVGQFGWPPVPAEKWHDTMAVAAQLVLPQKLELVLKDLDIPALKDMEGSALTIAQSKPLPRNRKQGGYYPERTPEVIARIKEYNLNDITSQVALHNRLGWQKDGERKVWLLDQKINDRGVRLDLDLVRSMQKIVDGATAPMEERFAELTGGLKMSQGARIKDWVAAQGVYVPDLQKETITKLLGEDPDSTEEEIHDLVDEWRTIPNHVRAALRTRQLVTSAAVKKLPRMLSCVSPDGRARGLLQYHGAGPGRWAGRLLQPQNFPRGSLGKVDIDELVVALLTGDPGYVEALYGPPVEAVLSALRHTLIAEPGHAFVAGDFASIEARVCLALAGQWDKVALLASGADVYCDMATSIYGRSITKADMAERQTGKNSVLGLGFQMGAPKFFARYCQDQSLEFAKGVVDTYRKSWAPEVPKLWYGLNDAAIETVWTGEPHEAFGIEYAMCDRWLTARLHSGRRLWYFEPQRTREAMPWDPNDIRPGFTYKARKTGKSVRVKAFGGLLTENVVQGTARDLMVEAAFRAEANGFPVVLTVHDELLTEVERQRADPKALEQIMSERSAWAAALKIPVATEAWSGERYRK